MNTNSSLNSVNLERLTEAFNHLADTKKAKSKSDVARIMNTSRSAVSQAFAGHPRYATKGFILRFNHAFGNIFNENYLLGGEGSLLRSQKQTRSSKKQEQPIATSHSKKIIVSRFNEVMAHLLANGIAKNKSEAAAKMGVSRPSLSKAFNGNGGYLTKNFVRRFNHAFGDIFNENYLLGGEGSLLRSQEQPQSQEQKQDLAIKRSLKGESNVTPRDMDEYTYVEFVELHASAGHLGGADPYDLPEYRRRLVPRRYGNGNYLVVEIDGNSMDDGTARSFYDGDELLIEQWLEDARNLPIRKSLFVIATNDGAVFKQIKQIDFQEQELVLSSFNSNYADIHIPFSEICQIFRVIKLVSRTIKLG